jgi:Domain of unknown function (DUF1127)
MRQRNGRIVSVTDLARELRALDDHLLADIGLSRGHSVRLFAFVAIFFALHLWLGLYLHPAEWPWNYMFLAIVHALFVLCAAGRSLGLDAWLRRNVPAVRERTVWWGRLLDAIG